MLQCTAVVEQDPSAKRVRSNGFWITFENGWTVSVTWAPMTYSDNRGMTFMEAFAKKDLSSKVAEIAAWNEDDTMWWDFDGKKPVKSGGYVKGWVKPDELIGYMKDVSEIALDVITASEYEYLTNEAEHAERLAMEEDAERIKAEERDEQYALDAIEYLNKEEE